MKKVSKLAYEKLVLARALLLKVRDDPVSTYDDKERAIVNFDKCKRDWLKS